MKVKNISKVFPVISLAFLMGACTFQQEGETHSLQTTHVNVENVRTDVKLSDFAEATLVPLPTSENLLIGKINRIRTSEKSICISDGNAIYRFSHTGKHLGTLSKKGQGPDEYAHISDFVIAEDENVWVLPNGKTSLLLYSWDNLLIKEQKIESSYSSTICRMGNKLILNNGNFITDKNKYTLQMIDLNTGITEQRFLPIDEYKAKYLYMLETNNFHPGESDTVCYFNIAHNDTIYRLTPNTCQAHRTFDWEGKNIPADFYHQDFMDIMVFNENLSDGKVYGTYFQLHSDKYQWVGYTQKGKGVYSAIIPQKGETPIILQEICLDNLEGYPMSIAGDDWEENKFVTGYNEITFILQPTDILDYFKEHAPEAMDGIKKKIQYTSEEQNPVLMIVKLK